ncbi:transposable element Tc1 transposase [Trichonephila clavipes]|nr:transposable element Tc1 transposase [Trichonephila clavipes]
MAQIVRHNDESVREEYIRNGGKEVKLFTSALKVFQCNNRTVMEKRKRLDDFLGGRIIGRLECGRTQLEVSEELGIAQSAISRLSQQFQDDGNVSRCYNTSLPHVTTPNEDLYIFDSYCQKKQTEHSIRPVSSALFSYQYDSFKADHVQTLRAHRSICSQDCQMCSTYSTHCHLRLTWSREHALWTPQQWSCVMFSDESRFSLQSDSHRTLIWRAPGTRYHQENTIERHRYVGEGWLVWGGLILGSRTDLHVQSVTMTSFGMSFWNNMYVLFGAPWVQNFFFMDDNTRPHRANIVDECLQSEDITRMDWPAYSPDLNPIEHVWDMLGRRIAARHPLPPVYRNFGGHCLMSGVIFPKIRLII